MPVLACVVLGPLACADEPAAMSPIVDGGSEASSEDGAETSETGGCFEAPEICLRLVECVGALAPGQREQVEAEYGAEGSCWCGTEAEAQACYETCVVQVEQALAANPTEPACQESVCPLEELDPSEPYGPLVEGACPDWGSAPQLPAVEPLGLPGSVCLPACSGIAKFCPDHSQTTADGTCYLSAEGQDHCVSRCWVDSTVIGGTQCQCGAVCQPHGVPDAEGNLRGVCTFP